MEILIIIIKIITEQVNLNELSLKLERLFRTFFFKYILLTMTIAITIVMNNLSISNFKMMSDDVLLKYRMILQKSQKRISNNNYQGTSFRNNGTIIKMLICVKFVSCQKYFLILY